ncbi:MAG: heavy metal translocating P-type ATPase [Clostridiales bacterium]|nr:heavy metal translocating P-type ATPase [Clostridiales bacterium]
MNKKQRNNLIRIIVAAVLLIVLHFVHLDRPIMLVCYMVPYLIVGYDILKKAGKGIVNRQPLDENLLMAIATIGAIALAVYKTGDFTEAVAVMLFYQVGELFQSYAVGKSRRNIGELMDIRPDYANIEEDGELTKVDPDEVEIGTIIIVQPGEKIPIDGIVEEGKASLDTSALTGESVPRSVKEGDEVISGCINTNGVLKIRTTREFDESTASKILDLVENASSRKARSENFISRFARVYTPIVVICAVLLAIVPPIISMAALGIAPNWGTWIYRALTFLVISCPCALVISIPLSFFAGIGGASREGILVKGSNYLEALSKVKTVVMDKTGTLTRGVFEVTGIYPSADSDLSEEEILHLAAHAERHSSHPIAQALRVAFGKEHDGCEVDDVEEIAGHGIRAKVDGKLVCIGNQKMVRLALGNDADVATADIAGTVIHVIVDGKYEGYIIISDVIKETSAEAIRKMREAGVTRQVMLTGDGKAVAEEVGSQLGISEIYSELLPADKVSKVEELLESGKQCLAFVGDGINDAPVLSRADIGIAMGALGSDAAIEAADVVLMDDDPLKIAKAIRISRKCMRIVHENIWFAIGIKVLCLLLCAVGLVGMWAAIFADVGVMVLAVLNAIRTLFV